MDAFFILTNAGDGRLLIQRINHRRYDGVRSNLGTRRPGRLGVRASALVITHIFDGDG